MNYFLGPKSPHYLGMAPQNLSAAIDYGWFDFVPSRCSSCCISSTATSATTAWHHPAHRADQGYFLAPDPQELQVHGEMKKLQPLLSQLREKYKGDRQKMNEEMMQLYKTYKVNPAGAVCHDRADPGVFRAVPGFAAFHKLRHAAFITHLPSTNLIWLADLSAKDPFYLPH